jgi:GTP cyclohydrolase III
VQIFAHGTGLGMNGSKAVQRRTHFAMQKSLKKSESNVTVAHMDIVIDEFGLRQPV